MRLLYIAILLFISASCRADDAGTSSAVSWGLPELMQSMASVKASRKTFAERKYMSVLTVPLESSGTLAYRAPSWLEKHTLQPKDEKMVLDHGIIVIYNRAGQVLHSMMVDQYPAIGAFVESMRATLAGDLKSLQRYYQLKLEGNAKHWQLQLLPKEQETSEVVREIRMAGHSNMIDSVEIMEANGDHSVMTVTAK